MGEDSTESLVQLEKALCLVKDQVIQHGKALLVIIRPKMGVYKKVKVVPAAGFYRNCALSVHCDIIHSFFGVLNAAFQ